MQHSTAEWRKVEDGRVLRALAKRKLIREPALPLGVRWGRACSFVEVSTEAGALTSDEPVEVALGKQLRLMKLHYAAGQPLPYAAYRVQEGDKFVCRSGAQGDVISLQNRYENDIECLRAYDGIYNIVSRLGLVSVEEAWKANPLTVSTTNPGDLQVI